MTLTFDMDVTLLPPARGPCPVSLESCAWLSVDGQNATLAQVAGNPKAILASVPIPVAPGAEVRVRRSQRNRHRGAPCRCCCARQLAFLASSHDFPPLATCSLSTCSATGPCPRSTPRPCRRLGSRQPRSESWPRLPTCDTAAAAKGCSSAADGHCRRLAISPPEP